MKYPVVVVDPPWKFNGSMRRVHRIGEDQPYQWLEIDEILSMDLPLAENAHLFIWATQRFLPDAIDMVNRHGRYSSTFVWHKPGGMKPFYLPYYNAEFAVYGRVGKPEFRDTKQFFSCFTAPRGRHSEKPQHFYDVIRRVTDGPRLDMFARQERPGFDNWGNEAPTPVTL